MLHSLILRRLALIKNETVAKEMGWDPSFLSRVTALDRGVRINDLERFLELLGIRCLENEGDLVVMSAEEARALQVLARKGLRFDGGM